MPLNAYRINTKGLDALDKKHTDNVRKSVDDLTNCPQCGTLLEVHVQMLHNNSIKAIDIRLRCKNCKYEFPSSIADIEEVSYVINPYIPKIPRVDFKDWLEAGKLRREKV